MSQNTENRQAEASKSHRADEMTLLNQWLTETSDVSSFIFKELGVTSNTYYELDSVPVKPVDQLDLMSERTELLLENSRKLKFLLKEIAYLTKADRD